MDDSSSSYSAAGIACEYRNIMAVVRTETKQEVGKVAEKFGPSNDASDVFGSLPYRLIRLSFFRGLPQSFREDTEII
jgi:rRNA processing protein Gar1